MIKNGETEAAFHILTPPRAEDTRRQIADICSIHPGDVLDHEVEEIYNYHSNTTPFGLRTSTAEKYFPWNPDSEEFEVNTMQGIAQRAEVLFDLPLLNASYGVTIPSYLPALREVRETGSQTEGHEALLLGALSFDTVREFSTTVRTVFPDANCTVIDIKDTVTNGKPNDFAEFMIADALDLPFPPGSQDSVHTNFLIPFIDGKSGSKGRRRERLFSEASRVLKDDGTLIMIEPKLHDDLDIEMIDGLHKSGFRSVSVDTAKYFKKRTDMERFLRSTAGEPMPTTVRRSSWSNVIVAKKSNTQYGILER
jgi:hypothetical protein